MSRAPPRRSRRRVGGRARFPCDSRSRGRQRCGSGRGPSSVAPSSDTDRAWPGVMPGPTKLRATTSTRKMLRLSLFGPVTLRFGDDEIRRQKPEAACDAGLHRAERVAPRNQGTAGRPAVGANWGGAGPRGAAPGDPGVARPVHQRRVRAGAAHRPMRSAFSPTRSKGRRLVRDPQRRSRGGASSVARAASAGRRTVGRAGGPRPGVPRPGAGERETLCDRLMRLLETALADDRLDPRKESMLAEAILEPRSDARGRVPAVLDACPRGGRRYGGCAAG